MSQHEAAEAVQSVTTYAREVEGMPMRPLLVPGPDPAAEPGLPTPSNLARLGVTATAAGPGPAPTSAPARPAHPVWSPHGGPSASDPPVIEDTVSLLLFLCKAEAERLSVWASPLSGANGVSGGVQATLTLPAWQRHIRSAWKVDPQLAVTLVQRFPHAAKGGGQQELLQLLTSSAHDPALLQLPDAAVMLAAALGGAGGSGKAPAALSALSCWAPGSAVQGLELMGSAAGRHPAVKAYAVRYLQVCMCVGGSGSGYCW